MWQAAGTLRAEKRRTGNCKSDQGRNEEEERIEEEIWEGTGVGAARGPEGAPRTTPNGPTHPGSAKLLSKRAAPAAAGSHRVRGKFPGQERLPSFSGPPGPAPAGAAGSGTYPWTFRPRMCPAPPRSAQHGRDAPLGTPRADPVALECTAARNRPGKPGPGAPGRRHQAQLLPQLPAGCG